MMPAYVALPHVEEHEENGFFLVGKGESICFSRNIRGMRQAISWLGKYEPEEVKEERKQRRARMKARRKLPLLYADLKYAEGEARRSIEYEIDECERLLEVDEE